MPQHTVSLFSSTQMTLRVLKGAHPVAQDSWSALCSLSSPGFCRGATPSLFGRSVASIFVLYEYTAAVLTPFLVLQYVHVPAMVRTLPPPSTEWTSR